MTMSFDYVFASSSKKEKKKSEYAVDTKLLTRPQLLELLERQNKLIASKQLEKLHDKGERVKLLKHQIEEELGKPSKPENLCDEFVNLKIKEKEVELIEWGDKEDKSSQKNVSYAESKGFPDDEQNPFAILANHSGTSHNQRIFRVEEAEEPLVTLEDIEEAHAVSLRHKIDQRDPPKERFLPHKTLNKTKSATRVRDLSAATPLPPVYGNAKLITIEESIGLQYQQTQHLREVQLKHATERLKELQKYKLGSFLPQGDSVRNYREQNGAFNEEESEEENHEADE